jgi:tetratricopeptide (TPR) repeat protein
MKKMKTIPRWTIKLSALVIFSLTGCFETSSEKSFQHAEKLLEQNKVTEAEAEFQKTFSESPDKKIILQSAKRLYEISYFKTKNYPKAITYLQVIIANSDSFGESIEALKKKAMIEEKYLLQYEAAITSYSSLLSHSELSIEEENEFRIDLVKCLFAINKFEQARAELKPLLLESRAVDVRIAAKNLEASILQAEGFPDKAVESYEAALELATSDKDKQDILINIAMCYEQKEQYKKAVEALNKIQLAAPFLVEKKKQLERLAKFKERRLNR